MKIYILKDGNYNYEVSKDGEIPMFRTLDDAIEGRKYYIDVGADNAENWKISEIDIEVLNEKILKI